MTQYEKNIYAEGIFAYLNRDHFSANPYDPHFKSDEFSLWNKGYSEVQSILNPYFSKIDIDEILS